MATASKGQLAREEFDDSNTPEFFRKAVKASRKADLEETKPIRANPCTSQMDYSDDEREFLMAVDSYKTRTGRLFLTNTEYFNLMVKTLGYMRVEPLPTNT